MLSEDQYKSLISELTESVGSFDHPDWSVLEKLAKKYRIPDEEAYRAVFVARDYQSLLESEKLDGGSGAFTHQTPITGQDGLDTATFSKGE